ncbi:MAG: hypothetical protein Greene07144_912, partial [Parcubacteria group bacterium Greene0714_4]
MLCSVVLVFSLSATIVSAASPSLTQTIPIPQLQLATVSQALSLLERTISELSRLLRGSAPSSYLVPPVFAAPPVLLNLRVSTGADDAEERTDTGV